MQAPVPGRPELFATGLPFPLDAFQRRAIDAVDGDQSVLVAAPTGSGKTVVAEFACWLALETGTKCFYTTPLKALSNQKFGDLVAQHGARNVGLLTGDNSINGEAPLVVMTTEVLRNMLYERSSTLHGLRWVVMDEVHYLQDRYRGAVWEEVLIHLPPEVRVVCLSATVSNVDEFGDWLRTLRGETSVVLETERPVELRNLVMIGSDLVPLLDERGRADADLQRLWTRGTISASRQGSGSGRKGDGRPRRNFDSTYTPRRTEVAETLQREGMLPAICFIFSRVGCDEAVDACARAGLQLTTDDEALSIREFAAQRCANIDPDDLRALRYGAFMDGLERGLAAHHAGMLPIFKETVEELFALGLVKLVFATETLSLGINMPARSVVIERLSKFTGEKHELLTPIEYTQLTGRAGRRGMDDLGFGVTLFSPWITLDKLASLATTRAYELTSSFRPSFNMAVNLVRNHDHEKAAHLLNSSFAQFTTDRNVVQWEHEVDIKDRRVKEIVSQLDCECGDIREYQRLRAKAAEAASDKRGNDEVTTAITRLAPGDVVWPDRMGRALIVEQASTGGKGGGPRITAMTVDRKLRRIGPRDFRDPPEVLAKVRLKGQAWRSPKARKNIARELETLRISRPGPVSKRSDAKRYVQRYEAHPCHSCPDVADHMRLADELADLERDTTRLHKLVRRRRNTISRVFDRVISVLTDLGYVDDWSLTPKGELLTRVYNEADLLVVESLSRGWFDGLGPDELAAIASSFVFESRRRDEPEPPPTTELARHEQRIASLYRELRITEREHDIELLKEPDSGFMAQIHEWSSGTSLEDILEDRETSAGDFVRSTKQVIDLLQQLRILATGELADTLSEAVRRIQRGVVAYSSVV